MWWGGALMQLMLMQADDECVPCEVPDLSLRGRCQAPQSEHLPLDPVDLTQASRDRLGDLSYGSLQR